MVLAELAGLAAGLVVAVMAFRLSRIREPRPPATLPHVKTAETGPEEPWEEESPEETRRVRTTTKMQEANVEFEFDNIFKLKLKSKGYAQLVMYGLATILFALAFLIVCVGIRTLGFGA
jgi:outer membrane protein OmpA-like peptidoglycan-associated protein